MRLLPHFSTQQRTRCARCRIVKSGTEVQSVRSERRPSVRLSSSPPLPTPLPLVLLPTATCRDVSTWSTAQQRLTLHTIPSPSHHCPHCLCHTTCTDTHRHIIAHRCTSCRYHFPPSHAPSVVQPTHTPLTPPHSPVMLRRRNSHNLSGEEAAGQRSTDTMTAPTNTPHIPLVIKPAYTSQLESLSPLSSPDSAKSPNSVTETTLHFDAHILPADTTVNSSAASSVSNSSLPSPFYLDRLATADPLLGSCADDKASPLPASDTTSSCSSSPSTHPSLSYDYFSSPTFPVSSIVSQLFGLSCPNILTCLIQNLIQLSSTLFLGHVSTTALSSAVVGNMICNLTGFSTGLGFTTCLDALCSQAYGGRRYMLCGLHAQKGVAMMTIACVPVGLVWRQTRNIALLMGLDEQTAEMAQLWADYLLFGMWPFFTFQVLLRWLAAQRVLWPVVAASIATIVWNLAGNAFFIYKLDWGFRGPAVVMALSYWVMLSTLVVCIVGRQRWIVWKLKQREEEAGDEQRRKELAVNATDSEEGESETEVNGTPVSALAGRVPTWPAVLTKNNAYAKLAQDTISSSPTASPQLSSSPAKADSFPYKAAAPSPAAAPTSDDTDFHDCWPPLSYAIFTNWGEHLRLGLPGAMSLFLEWGSYEVSAAFAGLLGGTRLAVHGVYMSSVGLWYTVPLGISSATAAMIGNQLGGGEARNAALTARIAMMCCLVWGLGNGFVFTTFLRPHWIALFSNDPDVQHIAISSMDVLLFYGLFDSSKCVLMSILRGCGRPLITVYGNVLSCWLVQFPLAYIFLTQWHLGLVALWASMTAAWATATLVYGLVMATTDWNEECRKALARNDAGTDGVIESSELPSPTVGAAQEAVAVVEQRRKEKEVELWDHKQQDVTSDDESGLSSVESSTDDSEMDEREHCPPPAPARIVMVATA